jgi:hypothetical protein
MRTVAYYILREKTRLSETEANAMIFGVMAFGMVGLHGVPKVDHDSGVVPIAISCPFDPEGDVEKQMKDYITSQGGGHYLQDPDRYQFFMIGTKEGNPPEPTFLAMIVDRQPQSSDEIPPGVRACLDRGRRWEELQRFGDAMHCYEVGLDVYGAHPELLFRLGSVKLPFELLLPSAYQSLQKAHEALPQRTDVAYQWALCHVKLADAKAVEVQGATPLELKEMALRILEPAAAAAPKDPNILALARDLRHQLSDGEADNFFDTPQ